MHNATSAVSGTLPSTEQSTKTAAANYEAQTTNRSMNTTIGTAQQSLTFVNTSTRTNATLYCTKFVSANLNQTSIAANTWTYNFAAQTSQVTSITHYPVPSGSDSVPMCCYVWRPSTGAKVSNIFDGDSSSTYWDVGNKGQTDERSQHGTFAGSAVTCQVNDVIVVEAWIYLGASATTSATLSFYYDGTTVTSNSGTIVSNQASYLETPETLSFTTAAIDMTQVAAKTYSNKFITKV